MRRNRRIALGIAMAALAAACGTGAPTPRPSSSSASAAPWWRNVVMVCASGASVVGKSVNDAGEVEIDDGAKVIGFRSTAGDVVVFYGDRLVQVPQRSTRPCGLQLLTRLVSYQTCVNPDHKVVLNGRIAKAPADRLNVFALVGPAQAERPAIFAITEVRGDHVAMAVESEQPCPEPANTSQPGRPATVG